jgi:predicted ATP-binding protein involved in virulence
VLIDEIETHLHIDLQKKILPFLTNFFPKIQFIVTTHSPFVLNSIKNAVVFDLEKKVLVEDMTGYSINSIVESYFDSANYSTVVKEKVIEYENLLNRSDLNEEEEEKLFDLKRYFKDLPKMFSPELALKINQLTLANLTLK